MIPSRFSASFYHNQMANSAVSTYLYNVLKLNTAYYTTGIYKKQLIFCYFIYFIKCLEFFSLCTSYHV